MPPDDLPADDLPVVLPDYLAPDLKVLFCGTAPGLTSAALGHYYARPGNAFWRLLAETGMTPRRLSPQEDALMPGLGLGLTDLAKHVAGQDADLAPEHFLPQRLAGLIARWQPRRIAFTSLNAARIALGDRKLPMGLADGFAGCEVWALPSPSGLARRHFSMVPWQGLAAAGGGMNPIWFLRMARWVRHPPSWQRVVLVAAVLAICLALAGIEWLWGWPEWLTVNGRARLPKP